jgi:FHA domain
MATHVCPKGHLSTESDYCSECGVKIQTTSDLLGVVSSPSNPSNSLTTDQDPFSAAAPTGGINCPACTAIHYDRDGNFCEICGYNFTTGQTADLPIVTLDPVPPPISPPTGSPVLTSWSITIKIDPSLATAASPPAPTQDPIVLTLSQPTNLIGRTSAVRNVSPEIPLDFDDAVSQRHALLVIQPDGSLMIRDIGSSNGIQFKGQDLTVMADVPLQSGDMFSLGHWTTIEVQQQ